MVNYFYQLPNPTAWLLLPRLTSVIAVEPRISFALWQTTLRVFSIAIDLSAFRPLAGVRIVVLFDQHFFQRFSDRFPVERDSKWWVNTFLIAEDN